MVARKDIVGSYSKSGSMQVTRNFFFLELTFTFSCMGHWKNLRLTGMPVANYIYYFLK